MTYDHELDAEIQADILADYALVLGQRVEVELVVVGPPTQVGPRLVDGEVIGATGRVLLVDIATAGGRAPRRTVRVPWPAIALIRSAATPHPATT